MRATEHASSGPFMAANNYAVSLLKVKRFEEARSLLRKTMPVARRVLGDSHETAFRTRLNYARAFYEDTSAMLDDLRESVETLDDLERTARRVLGTAHPLAAGIEAKLRDARAALHARETQDAFRTARTKLAQERADADASARPSGDAA